MYGINVCNIERKDTFKDALKVFLLFTCCITLVIPSTNEKYDYGTLFKWFKDVESHGIQLLYDYGTLFKWFKDVASHGIQLLYDYKFIEYFIKVCSLYKFNKT